MSKQTNERRDNYRVFHSITTRWMDNDAYGHVNNVTYYSYFDTAANHYLIHQAGLDIEHGEVIAFVVNSGCNYVSAIAYPDEIEVGLRVDKLGNSSVQYGLAVFKKGENQASAHGHFVHVFVNRADNQPVRMPERIRQALSAILVTPLS